MFDGGVGVSVTGSGVGLALTKKVMTSFEGDIGLNQHSGAGKTFTLSLPAVANSDAQPQDVQGQVSDEVEQAVA